MDLLSNAPFSLPQTFRAVDDAIDANADIAEAMIDFSAPMLGIDGSNEGWKGKAKPNDMDKARSTIIQLYRDWSAEGAAERHACYQPILAALTAHLPTVSEGQRCNQYVLVPGAGLGRLVFEACALGYSVQGNEISYHQTIASNYMLNATKSVGQHNLYPWALTFSNHLSRANQLESVPVPDIVPSVELATRPTSTNSEKQPIERLSMTSGDFCLVYQEPHNREQYDAVATCFFIDTAPNVIRYIETIKYCLKPGGIWINLGPLLWHFETSSTPAQKDKQRHDNDGHEAENHPSNTVNEQGIGEPGSFELSNDEVIALLQQFDFEILEQSEAPAGATGYIQDPRSMLQNVYRPAFWVAKKIALDNPFRFDPSSRNLTNTSDGPE